MRLFFIFILGLILSGCSKPASCPVERVDLEVLLSRMTNQNTFAEAPLGDSFLESSYDRSGGNMDWAVYAKAGSNGRIKIFEAEGPGYLSRCWIASFYAEKWLFFFDGETEPRLTLTQKDFFGEKFPFVAPLAGKSGGGRYSLVPIPFGKSLRIEIEPTNLKPSNRNYFQINWTRLNLKPEAVESFPKELSIAQSNRVVAVNAAQNGLRNEQRTLIDDCLKDEESRTVDAGESTTFWGDSGEGVLETFCLRIADPSASEVMSKELLRGLRIQMFWDGAEQPSVDVPLGDFFCNPYYYRSFSSMPLAQIDGIFLCRFPMPYKKGARCVLTNTTEFPVSVAIGAQGNRESTNGLIRKFHAVWHAQNVSGIPFKMMKTSGAGHYVGCFLSAIGQDGTWTILEGDEFLRPDPDQQPPQLGTGLEDYFNGAYYYTSLFDLPFHGLIEKGAMRTDQYRFHMLEAVRFVKSFEAGIEFGDQNHARGMMSSVVYWYADRVMAVPLSTGQSSLLSRPGDRFELPGLMSQFFLLEREGLYADAAARMEFFAERYSSQPWADRLKVRALGYREKVSGFDAVRSEYESFVGSTDPKAAEAAQNRLWLAEAPSHALLGIHALGKYRLSQDGKLVAEGDGQNDLRVLRLPVSNGDHNWDIELAPTRQGSFCSLCLRTQGGDITSAGDWKIMDAVPFQGRTLPEKFEGRSVLPNMTIWAFEPNAVVNMQSPAMGINLWSFWDSTPVVEQVRLTKSWYLGETVEHLMKKNQERTEGELKAHAIN